MKRLILALLLSATAIVTLGRAPDVAAFCDPNKGCYICSSGEVWRAFYYRQSQSLSSPECGHKYFTCEGITYQYGCTTPYYTTTIFCGCP